MQETFMLLLLLYFIFMQEKTYIFDLEMNMMTCSGK